MRHQEACAYVPAGWQRESVHRQREMEQVKKKHLKFTNTGEGARVASIPSHFELYARNVFK